ARVTQTAPRQAESAAGWRRVGDNPRTGNTPGGQQGSAPGRSATEAAGGAGGWRRVGDSPNHHAAPASDPATGRESSGWGRFGAIENRNRSAAPSANGRAPEQQAPEHGGWSRFGEPSSRIQAAPNANRENLRSQPAAQENWRGIEQQSGVASRGMDRTEIAPRTEVPSANRFENRTPRQERIQVSPPVVRERSSAPAIQRGGGSSFGGGRVSRSETSVSRGSSGGSSRGGSSHGGRTR
ncbi:MAG: hypothetical protein M1541_05490, partial [Acidobacteria bacterium]|nr:hypothetical protein [Acidobacteriota bacterium]